MQQIVFVSNDEETRTKHVRSLSIHVSPSNVERNKNKYVTLEEKNLDTFFRNRNVIRSWHADAAWRRNFVTHRENIAARSIVTDSSSYRRKLVRGVSCPFPAASNDIISQRQNYETAWIDCWTSIVLKINFYRWICSRKFPLGRGIQFNRHWFSDYTHCRLHDYLLGHYKSRRS